MNTPSIVEEPVINLEEAEANGDEKVVKLRENIRGLKITGDARLEFNQRYSPNNNLSAGKQTAYL